MGATIWRFNSGNEVVNFDSYDWEPALIKRESISQSKDKTRNEIMVSVHRSNLFARQFIAATPEQYLEFKLYRGHASFYETYWVGSVVSFRFTEHEVEMTIAPPYRAASTTGLRRKYQKMCSYNLYDNGCFVNKLSYEKVGTIATINGKTITSQVFGTVDNGWFVGGQLVSGITQRLIIGHTGTSITLVNAVPNLRVGDAFAAYAGCSHSYATCGSKFNNKINFGGQPWIPSVNPFAGGKLT
jgi:uncharacterized phage protein (TIGR02218 family)